MAGAMSVTVGAVIGRSTGSADGTDSDAGTAMVTRPATGGGAVTVPVGASCPVGFVGAVRSRSTVSASGLTNQPVASSSPVSVRKSWRGRVKPVASALKSRWYDHRCCGPELVMPPSGVSVGPYVMPYAVCRPYR